MNPASGKKPSWWASGSRLLWFMVGIGWAAMLSWYSLGASHLEPMLAALLAASMPATMLQTYRFTFDLYQEYRAKRRAKGGVA